MTFHDKCVRFSDKFVVTIRAGSFLAANDRAVPLECDQILWKKRRQINWKLTVTVVPKFRSLLPVITCVPIGYRRSYSA